MSLVDSRSDPVHCFSVFALAEASVVPRVLELFAKRGLTPRAIHGALDGPGNDGFTLDLQVGGLTAERAEHIAQCLRQMVSVERVLTAVKSNQPAAVEGRL